MADKTASVYIKLQSGEAEKNMKNYRKALRETRREIDGAKKGSKEYRDAVKKFKQLDKVVKDHNKQLYGMRGAWKQAKAVALGFVGGSVISGGIRLIGRAFSDARRVVADFEQANSSLNAVLGVSKEQTAALRDQQIKLGSSTAFTAANAAEAQTELAKLGFTMEEITNLTPAVLDLAAASGTDLPNAAAIAGSTLRQFNLDASEAGRVVDVMAKSFSSSALDIEKYKVGMAAAGPVAANAGVSLERTTALLGTLVDRGLDASTAGTSLRNVYLKLAESGMTYEEALARIRNASDKNAVALELFGTRGATTGVILADTAEQADKLTTSLENATGAAEAMAETKLDNLRGDVTKLQSAWEGFILSVENGEGVLAEVSRGFLQGLTEIIGNLSDTERISAQLQETLGLDYWKDGLLSPNLYSGLAELQESINVWGDSAREAFGKGNVKGGIGDIDYLKELRKEYEGNQQALKLINTEIASLQDTRNEAVLKQYVTQVSETVGTDDPTDSPIATEDQDAADKAAEKEAEKLAKLSALIEQERQKQLLAALEGREKEEAAIDQHYAKLMAKAEGHAEQMAMLEDLKAQAKSTLAAKHSEEEQRLADEAEAKAIGDIEKQLFDNMTETEQVTAHYDALLLLAQEHGFKVAEVEAAKAAAIKSVRDKDLADATQASREKAQAEIQNAQLASGALFSIVGDVAGLQSKNAKFQADMAMYQQFVNAGLSLSAAVAAGKGVTPIDYLASIAMLVGAVTTRIAFARKKAESAGSPPTPAFRSGSGSTPRGKILVGESGPEEIFAPAGSAILTAGETRGRSGAMFGPSFTGGYHSTGPDPIGASRSAGSGGHMAEVVDEIRSWQSEFQVVFSDKDHADFKTRQNNNKQYLGYRD